MAQVRLKSSGARALAFLLGLLFLTASSLPVLRWYAASRARTAQDAATLRWAVELEGDNAFYHHRLARWERFSLVKDGFERALFHYRRATVLNPYHGAYWFDFADALLESGDTGEAKAAVARALVADPRSPQTLWRAGNFWLRARQPDRSLPLFRQALEADENLAELVVRLSHRAVADTERVLREVLPPQPVFLSTYLAYLAEVEEGRAAARVWDALLELGQDFDPRSVLSYFDYLLRVREVERARRAWEVLIARGLLPEAGAAGDELLYNSDLRSPILNGGFGWQVAPHPRVRTRLGAGPPGKPDARALVVRFSGEENIHYRHFYQFVAVEPQRRYRFAAWLRTEGISTESGLRLEVLDAYDPERLTVRGPGLVGTKAWARQEVEFTAGPDTRLVRVGLVRLPSQRLDNQVRGTVWASRFSLEAVPVVGAGR